MTEVSITTAAALQKALERLLDGEPTCTDGELTVANLAREAGVSRATANRATAILARLRTERADRQPGTHSEIPATLRARVRQLESEIIAFKSTENKEIIELR
ncbi:hypothetical protein [Nocardia sp. NPDC059239]|uniref:hypothetical protein n=1 Tax=Nocardia sp. NPDC059239 TaxID=3346785 RepID=UPI0036CC930D